MFAAFLALYLFYTIFWQQGWQIFLSLHRPSSFSWVNLLYLASIGCSPLRHISSQLASQRRVWHRKKKKVLSQCSEQSVTVWPVCDVPKWIFYRSKESFAVAIHNPPAPSAPWWVCICIIHDRLIEHTNNNKIRKTLLFQPDDLMVSRAIAVAVAFQVESAAECAASLTSQIKSAHSQLTFMESTPPVKQPPVQLLPTLWCNSHGNNVGDGVWLAKGKGIKHIHTFLYHPQANGRVDRFHQKNDLEHTWHKGALSTKPFALLCYYTGPRSIARLGSPPPPYCWIHFAAGQTSSLYTQETPWRLKLMSLTSSAGWNRDLTDSDAPKSQISQFRNEWEFTDPTGAINWHRSGPPPFGYSSDRQGTLCMLATFIK